jgi:hypothetical protein
MSLLTLHGVAEFSLHLYFGICLHLDEYMGDFPDVYTLGRCVDSKIPDMQYRTSVFALTNGGTAGLVWGYLIVWMGYMLVFATVAEMASM